MLTNEIQQSLFDLQDTKYRDFHAKLIPTVEPSRIIGVRTPQSRKLAKELFKRPDIADFLNNLPHSYYDENQLHAFILNEYKDYYKCIEAVRSFLPYIDNWATCDQLSPKVFKKHRTELLVDIKKWIDSSHIYTIRFGIGMLMQHFLDEAFDGAYPEMVCAIRSDEYYVNMMIAWYFATALAKQYDAILPYIEKHRLSDWTHIKTIQKTIESFRITDAQKDYLRSLK